jgi:hypothetical protein
MSHEKLYKVVKIPVDFKLEDENYKLISIVDHLGYSTIQGHYIT